jgi:hypothetical protein
VKAFSFSCRIKSPTEFEFVRFEVFTAVTMKKAVFLDVALCRCGVNRQYPINYNSVVSYFRNYLKVCLKAKIRDTLNI